VSWDDAKKGSKRVQTLGKKIYFGLYPLMDSSLAYGVEIKAITISLDFSNHINSISHYEIESSSVMWVAYATYWPGTTNLVGIATSHP